MSIRSINNLSRFLWTNNSVFYSSYQTHINMNNELLATRFSDKSMLWIAVKKQNLYHYF